jgi:uncharacterized protein (DUF433 family)
MQKMANIKHPYITQDTKICRGSPVIVGTRTRVTDIAIEYDRLGMTPDEIIDAHPYLTLEAVHDALSFYYENREFFDKDILKRKESLKKLAHTVPAKLKAALG